MQQGLHFFHDHVSKNHGRSWKVGNPTGEISSECQAVELLDGSVMLNIRSSRDKAHMHRAVMCNQRSWENLDTSSDSSQGADRAGL